MSRAHRRRQQSVVVALIVIFLTAIAAVPSASAANRHHRHGRHIEHILVVSSDPSDNATPIVIATGPIHAKGIDIVVSDTKDTFKFPRGSLFATHHVNKKSMKDSNDPVTCTFRHTERGTYRVTGGSGAYANARGHGHYSLRVLGVGCAQNKPPEFFSVEITAAGPLHLRR